MLQGHLQTYQQIHQQTHQQIHQVLIDEQTRLADNFLMVLKMDLHFQHQKHLKTRLSTIERALACVSKLHDLATLHSNLFHLLNNVELNVLLAYT